MLSFRYIKNIMYTLYGRDQNSLAPFKYFLYIVSQCHRSLIIREIAIYEEERC